MHRKRKSAKSVVKVKVRKPVCQCANKKKGFINNAN